MSSISQTSTPDRPRVTSASAVSRSGLNHLLTRMRRWQIYALLVLPPAYIIVFSYRPILGAQIAVLFLVYAVAQWISISCRLSCKAILISPHYR